MRPEKQKEPRVCIDNFNELYKLYGDDLCMAARMWLRKLPKNMDMMGILHDHNAIKSIIDEIFLECVKSWSYQKNKNCKFRSYLITQLNRRFMNYIKKHFKKHRAIPPNKVFPLHDILNNRNKYPEVYTGWDIRDLNDEDEVTENEVLDKLVLADKGLNYLLSNDIEKSLVTSECLKQLSEMSPMYRRVLNRLEQLVNSDDEGKNTSPHKQMFRDMNLEEWQYKKILQKMKKDLLYLLYKKEK